MQNEKCIPIKKKLISYMSTWFPDFLFQGGNSQFYAFRRENPNGIYDHIIIQREYYEGTVSLVVTEAASCYNKSWKGIPWLTVGYDTDIGVIISGQKQRDTNIGWHRCDNNAEKLYELFDEIRNDIDTYILAYFTKCHEKINPDRCMVITNSYMQAQFAELSKENIDAVQEYLVNVNKAYTVYRKICRKNGKQETTTYFDIIPLHPIVEHWLTDIQEQLNYPYLSEEIRTQLIRYTTVLFRDNYNFYNLK